MARSSARCCCEQFLWGGYGWAVGDNTGSHAYGRFRFGLALANAPVSGALVRRRSSGDLGWGGPVASAVTEWSTMGSSSIAVRNRLVPISIEVIVSVLGVHWPRVRARRGAFADPVVAHSSLVRINAIGTICHVPLASMSGPVVHIGAGRAVTFRGTADRKHDPFRKD